MKLLLAEDDKKLLKSLTYILEKNNYIVDSVSNGKDAFLCALTGEYDGMILDIMMPGLSGLEIVKKIRQKKIAIPVIFLTARTEVYQRVEGLDAGADDYLTKPFSIDELLARVRAMLRRKDNYRLNMFNIGDCILNRSTYELCYVKNKILLSKKEFQIMEMLMERPKEIIPIDKIITRVWGWDTDVDTSVVWVHISNLRKKIELLGAPLKICFLRNAGYFLDVTVEEKS